MTERDVWLGRMMKPGFITEAVAAIQVAALQQHVKLNAEPWEIAKAIGELMEE